MPFTCTQFVYLLIFSFFFRWISEIQNFSDNNKNKYHKNSINYYCNELKLVFIYLYKLIFFHICASAMRCFAYMGVFIGKVRRKKWK